MQSFYQYHVAPGNPNTSPRQLLLALGMHLQDTKPIEKSVCADSIRLRVSSSVFDRTTPALSLTQYHSCSTTHAVSFTWVCITV